MELKDSALPRRAGGNADRRTHYRVGQLELLVCLGSPAIKNIFGLRRFTSAVRCYRVGLTLLGRLAEGGLR